MTDDSSASLAHCSRDRRDRRMQRHHLAATRGANHVDGRCRWPSPHHPIPVMRAHLPAAHHGRMDPAPARYTIRINGHLGAMMLSAFPAMVPQWQGTQTVLTGLLDRSALYGVLAEIDALGLDLLEVRHLEPDPESPDGAPL